VSGNLWRIGLRKKNMSKLGGKIFILWWSTDSRKFGCHEFYALFFIYQNRYEKDWTFSI
jgi:hypothetical protein